MNKKLKPWFISLLCLTVTIVLLKLPPQAVASYPTVPASTELRGVWLTNVASAVLFLPWGVNRALNQLSKLNFNTVYPAVWNRGHTFYPSAVAKEVTGKEQAPVLGLMRLGQNNLAEIVKQGHLHKLRIIPWFEYGFMTPPNSELARRHPNWLTNRRDSTKILKEVSQEQKGYKKLPKAIQQAVVSNQVWLNPFHQEVQQFLLDLIVEVVTNYDVDGVQLDDHFGLPVELGYDPFTVKLYQQEHEGKKPPKDPKDPEWMRWRADKITDFMEVIYQTVKAIKPNAIISLSPNSQIFAYEAYLQDWHTWIKRGLITELVLQVYRSDMKNFAWELSQPVLKMARRRIPVSIGILTGTWGRPVKFSEIQKQVKMVRERGFKGVSFFYWESLWGYITPESPQKRREAFQALFYSPVRKNTK